MFVMQCLSCILFIIMHTLLVSQLGKEMAKALRQVHDLTVMVNAGRALALAPVPAAVLTPELPAAMQPESAGPAPSPEPVPEPSPLPPEPTGMASTILSFTSSLCAFTIVVPAVMMVIWCILGFVTAFDALDRDACYSGRAF